MEGLVQLISDLATGGQITHIETTPARAARFAPFPPQLHPAVRAAYENLGIQQLWCHQRAALDALTSATTTVLATGTGSGKSLPVWAQLFSAVEHWREARAGAGAGKISTNLRRPTMLYLTPTKALAADQVHAARGVIAAGALSASVATLDGDTSQSQRRQVREGANAICTNPDFLHFSLLANHDRYRRILAGLQLVVVDEAHAYRGLFGAHVALVLRRLLRVARHYGAAPKIALLSATAAAPLELAETMLGGAAAKVSAITDDGSPRAQSKLVWWKPAPTSNQDVAALSANLARAGAQTLTFVRSRSFAETLAAHIKDLAQLPAGATVVKPSSDNPQPLRIVGNRLQRSEIAAYRGGYLPAERRELERALLSGKLRALTATNALELGIDIAGLDAVVIAGWPGSRASILQQAGRAGRGGTPGFAIFVARDDPLDQYLVDHPTEVVAAGVEHTVFDVTNPHVLLPHLCAAASELPLTRADFALFNLPDDHALQQLADRGVLRRVGDSWVFNELLARRAHDLTDLRGSGGHLVDVVRMTTGELLGTVSATSADAQVHQGAIYIHQGRHWQIESYDGQSALASEIPVSNIRTVARSRSRIALKAELSPPATAAVWTGAVSVHSQVIGYDRRDLRSGEIRSSHQLQLPEHTFDSVACAWLISPQLLAEAAGDDIAGALHAAEHALIALLPLIATCDRQDIGGISTALHADTLTAMIAIYDGAHGGAGFAARGFANRKHWIDLTAKRIAACPCTAGCPRCVISPKCGSGNTPLNKSGALTVLKLLAGAARATASS